MANPTAAKAMAPPETHLNRFVHIVAFIERAANGLGKLVFTWATVVILGGFSVMLTTREFRCATVLVLLEAARMFSQNRKLEYQFFFRTRGAFKRPRWNRVVLILCMAEIMVYVVKKFKWSLKSYSRHHIGPVRETPLGIMGMTMCMFVLGKVVCPPILNLFNAKERVGANISLWSPLAVILLSVPSLFLELPGVNKIFLFLLTAFLLTVVIIVTISELRVNGPIARKMLLFFSPVILFLCMGATLAILGYRSKQGFVAFFLIFALALESFGNLQIPAAIARVVIAMVQPSTLICVENVRTFAISVVNILFYTDKSDKSGEYKPDKNCSWTEWRNYTNDTSVDTKKNFMLSLNIFYVIVLIQGTLYIVACVLEIFSFILRIILVHQSKFRRPWGMKCIDQYYSYIFEQCISGGVLSKTNMELTSFAMDLTDSDSSSEQLDGVRMLHSFLKRKNTKAISTRTLERSISMLGWTTPKDAEIRLLAAEVVVELSRSLQVIAIPGSMQNISSLLDTDNQLRQQSPLLEYEFKPNDSQAGIQDTVVYTGDGQEHLGHNNQENSWMLVCWKSISKCWSIPQEETFIEHDILPVLRMSILETLAECDPDNCAEISKARDLIQKIIGYTNETQPKILKGSSLKLLTRLSNTGGEIGVTLRQKMSDHPFLLRNLAEILGDTEESQEHKKLAAEILRNLAIDGNTREEIGSIRVIISRLIQEFLAQHPPSNTYPDPSLQTTAGQALAMLAMGSVNNCSAMLKEPGYSFIRELTAMIRDDRYKYVAASLLQNLCLHAEPKLSSSDRTELSHSLRKVLERITGTTDATELEVFIGLSSQICLVVPEDFARELEHNQIKEIFVKKLVEALNANVKPTAHCPRIRRVIVEQVTNMMKNNSSYANCFNECQMMEALSVVEETPSKVENYRLFMGNAGLMKDSESLSKLVATAKETFKGRKVQALHGECRAYGIQHTTL